MARIIMIGNRKGGVLKTTTTVNLGYELSKLGKKVLVIDFDSQADATKFFTSTDKEFYIGNALLDRKFDIEKTIYKAEIKDTEQDNLHFIPSRGGDVMTKLDIDMISLPRREERLKLQLEKIANKYDYILIDTNPGTSVLGLNAVMAATEYIFPTEYKEHSLDGVETLLEHIQDVKFIEEDEIKFLVVPSKIAKSEKRAIAYGEGYLKSRWVENTSKTTIWARSLFTEAEFEHEPASITNPGHVAASFYKKLAMEVDNA
ncbi:ParA family protein [Psychromonas sp. B3M02]|uniref:ParA family protein n=1 Tax=Psychromonas sp. B3M02 TaxID=2267226 RepID=UPI000DE8CF6B|nr:AAA family ATPase [Psychromonas sp. B3M02]RBW47287.1 ParA family protein [Psychromonas sp. B3M02]